MAQDPITAPGVAHDAANRRFELVVAGVHCRLDYALAGRRMTIVHTGVPPAVAGRGIAAALLRSALEHARHQGWKVEPQCSYAAAFLRRHPEFDDLQA